MSSLMTVPEVAQKLSCATSTVYVLIESGRLAHYRCPGIRVSDAQLNDYLFSTERRTVRLPAGRLRACEI